MEKTVIDNATIITKVLHYACNIGFDKFKGDLTYIVEGGCTEQYAEELFDRMRDNFPWFFCNLDEGTKRRFVETALAHYGIVG